MSLAAVWLSACAESSVLPPAAPSALPEEKIGRLAIACPADVQRQSFHGGPVSIGFQPPSTTGGQAPVAVACTHESGHGFAIGVTRVECDAADALRQSARCAFRVSILGPPRLRATRFLAFGDSITDGWISPPDANARFDRNNSYPSLLRRELQSRYVTQPIQVINLGAAGEEARHALPRFRSWVRTVRPEVVLIMEGTNDLYGGGGPELAAQAIEAMIQYARGTGADVILMTIPPQVGTPGARLVASYNGTLRAIAARRGAALVDVHALFLRGPCSGARTTPCIGADGVHPTADGNRLIAAELARVIVRRYDVEILPEGAGRSNGAVRAGAGIRAETPAVSGERGR